MRNGRRTLSINYFSVCVRCVALSAVLSTDLDKFKVSVSICYDSVISQSSPSLCLLILCVCKCLYISVCVCVSVCMCEVHFAYAGLGDNYSRDHLFSGMRYNNKRLRTKRERKCDERGRERGTEGWRTTRQADSTSLTSLID